MCIPRIVANYSVDHVQTYRLVCEIGKNGAMTLDETVMVVLSRNLSDDS